MLHSNKLPWNLTRSSCFVISFLWLLFMAHGHRWPEDWPSCLRENKPITCPEHSGLNWESGWPHLGQNLTAPIFHFVSPVVSDVIHSKAQGHLLPECLFPRRVERTLDWDTGYLHFKGRKRYLKSTVHSLCFGSSHISNVLL